MGKPIRFETEYVANFEDLDINAHVTTSRYSSIFLQHRFSGLRQIGLDLRTINDLPVAIYTTKIDIEFLRPVFAEQRVLIQSEVTEWDEKSCEVLCKMHDERDKLTTKCRMLFSCIDKKNNKPTTWPEDFKRKFFIEGE